MVWFLAMSSSRRIVSSLLAAFLLQTRNALAVDVEAGYDPYTAVQAMVNLAEPIHSQIARQVFVSNAAVGDLASLGVWALKYSNGAISHCPDVTELWADNMAMSFPFLAYLAVQKGDTSLMATSVTQCGLQRNVLKTSQYLNWQHNIGPQSQDIYAFGPP
ncbi:hypothetical protein TrVGV298_010981, partial [Trichoderma virens]